MSGEPSSDTGSAPVESTLHENASKILRHIKSRDEEQANTTQIRDATGLTAANISGHHALSLIDNGLLEKAGTVEGDGPRDTNVYKLTPRGHKVANNLLKEKAPPLSDEGRDAAIRDLRNQVAELKRESGSGSSDGSNGVGGDVVQELREEIRDLREETDALNEQVNDNQKLISDHTESLRSVQETIQKLIRKYNSL